MKRVLFFLKLSLLVNLVWFPLAYAVPNLISYQGVLNDSSGTPVSSTVIMTFSIYDVETGGTALWSETQSVNVSNGLFNVQLGSVQQLISEVFNIDTLFLGIQVGSDPEMAPRQQITSAAFAHKTPFINQDFLPVGTIMARIVPSHEFATGSISVNPGNSVTDSNADFISANVKPKMSIVFNKKFIRSLNAAEWENINETIFSDSSNEGNLISKFYHYSRGTTGPGAFYVKFFYTDGSSSQSSILNIPHTQVFSWYTSSNPEPDKYVWKTEYWALGPLYILDGNLYLQPENIRSVDSSTQITLDSNLFKTVNEFNYTIYATPKLFDNWVECNGQTVIDPESPYYDTTLPDLNSGTPLVETTIPVIWIMRIK